MDDEGWIYKNKENKISKNFSIDDDTLLKVQEFMDNYGRENISKSISDLIYLGLSNLGYTDRKEAVDRIKFKNISPATDFTDLPFKDPKIAVYKIIKTLSQKSLERNAHRTEILLQARGEGITNQDTTNILEDLKNTREIYEPKKDYFKITEY